LRGCGAFLLVFGAYYLATAFAWISAC